jgi:hypothetical protein
VIEVRYSGGMGNQMFQYAWARCLAEEIGYELKAPPIEGFPRTHEAVKGKCFVEEEPQLLVTKVFRKDFSEIQANLALHGERKIVLSESPCEYYPTLAPFREKIRSWFEHSEPDLDLAVCDTRRKFEDRFVAEPITSIDDGDLVISLRLGDFLRPKHRHRLLGCDYFDIVLSSRTFSRLFITSDEIDHPLVDEFEKYRPIRLFQKDRWQTMKFVAKFDHIALSQSTYSWWCAYLSNARHVYFPLSDWSVWNKELIVGANLDLRVNEGRYIFVHYDSRTVVGGYERSMD